MFKKGRKFNPCPLKIWTPYFPWLLLFQVFNQNLWHHSFTKITCLYHNWARSFDIYHLFWIKFNVYVFSMLVLSLLRKNSITFFKRKEILDSMKPISGMDEIKILAIAVPFMYFLVLVWFSLFCSCIVTLQIDFLHSRWKWVRLPERND